MNSKRKRIEAAEKAVARLGASHANALAKQLSAWRLVGDERAELYELGQMIAVPVLDEPGRIIWLRVSADEARL